MIVMVIDVWDLQAIDALGDEMAFCDPSGQRPRIPITFRSIEAPADERVGKPIGATV